MKIIKDIGRLIHPKTNVEEMVCLVMRYLGLKVAETEIMSKLKKHPAPSSLLAVYDILAEYGVSSVAMKCNGFDKLQALKRSFIAQIKSADSEQEIFAFVYKIEDNKVDWYNSQKQRREQISLNDFLKLFTGYILVFEPSDYVEDINFKRSCTTEIMQRAIEGILILFLPLYLIATIIVHSITVQTIWEEYIYAGLLLIGCIIGGLLLAHEYNEYNPLVSHFCGQSAKLNCSAVLFSQGSRLWSIPWSVTGSAYFLGMLMSLLISGFNISIFTTIAFFHLLVLPYVVYSIYYQKTTVKQWCPLCLATQVIIVLLFLTALIDGTYSRIGTITLQSVLFIVGCLFLSSAMVYYLWLFSQKKRSSEYYEKNFINFKYAPSAFQSLLEQQQKINIPTDGYGITLGNKEGKIHIIKVCNPYCSHCADAQVVLQRLMTENSDIKLQIIFIFNPESEEYKLTPIDRFLSLYHEGFDMEPILTEWYTDKKKNIEDFILKHPVKVQSTNWNNDNAKSMFNFCEEMKITRTPTVFINGFRLPDTYSVKDLKYFY